MPQRSNEFQRLILLVKQQLAGNAIVTESKLLIDRLTGAEREVDICIETSIVGHPVVVSIECTKRNRPPDVTWVEQLKAKHERLPTNVLVLISHSGFSREVQLVAQKYGIETLSLEEVSEDSVKGLFGKIASLLVKSFELTPMEVVVRVAQVKDLPPENVLAFQDTNVCSLDGKLLCCLKDLIEVILRSAQLTKETARLGDESHKSFQVEWRQSEGKGEDTLCLQKIDPMVVRPIESISIRGTCQFFHSEFPLRHNVLGKVQITWATGSFFGRDALLVASNDESGVERLTIAADDMAIVRKNVIPERNQPES